jgi:hypothetical protein
MTSGTLELDEAIAGANFRITLDPDTGQTRTFKTFQEAKEFFEHEVAFWTPYADKLLPNVLGNFQLVLNALNQASQLPEQRANEPINQAAVRLQQLPFGFICSETPFAHFLVSLAMEDPELARAATAYRDGSFTQRQLTSSRENLEGILAAIAFKHPEFFSSGLEARIEAFDRKSAEASTVVENLVTHFETFHDGMEHWKNAIQAELSKTADSAKAAFSQTNAEWTETFKNTHTKAEGELASIRNAYQQQMRLKEPAQYWKSLEVEYEKKGRIWVIVSGLTVAAFAAAVTLLVYRPPALFLESSATLGGIKGTLLIGAGISMVIYVINLFVKMSTSSYHLARDAKERFQLTHVFLALIKDQAIEPKDRDIILSALFSRADTGLLKGDSSPTMPTALGTAFDVMRGK